MRKSSIAFETRPAEVLNVHSHGRFWMILTKALLWTLVFPMGIPAIAQVTPEGAPLPAKGNGVQVFPMPQSPFLKDAMQNMMSMHQGYMDMSAFNGNADHDFLAMMIPHHRGALEMAQSYLKFGTDERVRKLAQEIVSAQRKEIAQMEKWLKEGVGAKK